MEDIGRKCCAMRRESVSLQAISGTAVGVGVVLVPLSVRNGVVLGMQVA